VDRGGRASGLAEVLDLPHNLTKMRQKTHSVLRQTQGSSYDEVQGVFNVKHQEVGSSEEF
jgi:hypothetical protein